jgi:hypothetical protein
MGAPQSRYRRPRRLDAGGFQPGISSFRLSLAAEGKAAKTVRTYTEAVAWFAAAYLLTQTGRPGWEQAVKHDVQQWMVQLLGRYSAAYASNQFRSGHRGAKLTANAGDATITGPQALLVSNNPYEMTDIAGLGRRARLDAGTLGVVAVTVNNALQAAMLLRGAHGQGLTTLTAGEVVVDADVSEIPVGIDGETVMMATPVRCTIQPRALRVRVPRDRAGTRPPKPVLDWHTLRQLASFRSAPGHLGPHVSDTQNTLLCIRGPSAPHA